MSHLLLAATDLTSAEPFKVNGGRWGVRVKGLPANATVDIEMRFVEDDGDDDWVLVDGLAFDGDKFRAAFLAQDMEIRAKASVVGATVRVDLSEAGVS